MLVSLVNNGFVSSIQDVTGEVLAATRPLMRQIDQLQQVQADQQEQWERAEMVLSHQLEDAHLKVC